MRFECIKCKKKFERTPGSREKLCPECWLNNLRRNSQRK